METKDLLETNWLNGENTKDQDKVVVLDEGELVEQEGKTGKYLQLCLNVEHNKSRRKVGLNRMSHKAIAEMWGSDTKSWIGKVLSVRHVPDKVVDGKLKNKLVLMPVE